VTAGLLLAAGLARRMGRQKLVLPLRGEPIVRRAAAALSRHVDDLIVVTGHDENAVRAALAGLPARFVSNPRPEDGQASSVAAGVRALAPGTDAVIVALGDQPDLPDPVVPALLEAWRRTGRPVVAPRYRGTQANPVLFGASVFPELAALAGDGGARAVVRADPTRVAWVDVDAPVPADVDTPEDYERLM
jgi:molybdenum cofactor cytidylyltransferase